MKKLFLVTVAVIFAGSVAGQDIKPGSDVYVPKNEVRFSYSPFFGDYIAFSSDATQRFSGVSAFSCSYRLSKVTELGATVSFFYKKDDVKGAGLGPTMRFSWFRTPTVRLYSSFTIAIPFLADEHGIISQEGFSGFLVCMFAMSHFAPLGLTVGKSLFFTLEPLCLGGQGYFINAGVGYRFTRKRI